MFTKTHLKLRLEKKRSLICRRCFEKSQQRPVLPFCEVRISNGTRRYRFVHPRCVSQTLTAHQRINSTEHPTTLSPTHHTNQQYIYEPIRQTVVSDDLGEYVTYGIRVLSNGKPLSLVTDVSTDMDTVERLSALCTKEQLDPIHLMDVISDAIV